MEGKSEKPRKYERERRGGEEEKKKESRKRIRRQGVSSVQHGKRKETTGQGKGPPRGSTIRLAKKPGRLEPDTAPRGYKGASDSVRGLGFLCRDEASLARHVTASRHSVAGSNGKAPCNAHTQASRDISGRGGKGVSGTRKRSLAWYRRGRSRRAKEPPGVGGLKYPVRD